MGVIIFTENFPVPAPHGAISLRGNYVSTSEETKLKLKETAEHVQVLQLRYTVELPSTRGCLTPKLLQDSMLDDNLFPLLFFFLLIVNHFFSL